MSVDRRYRLPRIWSNTELKKIAPIFTGDIVNVSASDDGDKQGGHYKNYFLNSNHYFYTNYIGYRGYQNMPNEFHLDLETELPDHLKKRFEVVFNHTTLEHIFNVEKSFDNLCTMSKDIVIIVVPFVQVEHVSESYSDYWRFTPNCMRHLFKKNGFEVIYESANKDKNSSIYLFFIGSCTPEKWVDKIPPYKKIENVGEWIGSSGLTKYSQKIRDMIRHLIKGIEN